MLMDATLEDRFNLLVKVSGPPAFKITCEGDPVRQAWWKQHQPTMYVQHCLHDKEELICPML